MTRMYNCTAVIVFCIAFTTLILTGCGNKVQVPQSEVELVPPSADGLPDGGSDASTLPKLTAYIEMTSGCQKATIDAMEKAQSEYAGKIEFDVVDFGDGGAGAKRWQDSGIGCMALVFGDSYMGAWEQDGKLKVIDFRTPPGFNWTIEDFNQALAAFAAGTLREPTEEEAKNVQHLEPVAVIAKGQAVKADDGSEIGQLLIGANVVVELTAPAAGMSASARAKAAAKALEDWTGKPYKPSELGMKKDNGNIVISAGELVILTVTKADADAAGKPLSKVAAGWHKGIRCAVVSANSGEDSCCE